MRNRAQSNAHLSVKRGEAFGTGVGASAPHLCSAESITLSELTLSIGENGVRVNRFLVNVATPSGERVATNFSRLSKGRGGKGREAARRKMKKATRGHLGAS